MIPRRVQLCAVTLLCLVASGTTYAEACRSKSFKGAPYIVCTFDPAKDDLRIYWRGDDSKPYRTFAALAGDLEGKDKSLQFAMNGGMYQDDFRPVGLYIENGRDDRPIPLRSPAPPARYRTLTKSRTACSISATGRPASSIRDDFLPIGRKQISLPSPDRRSSSTAPSIRPSSSTQTIASRGTASACRANSTVVDQDQTPARARQSAAPRS